MKLAIPRHTTPPSSYLARLVSAACGVPVSWETDLNRDHIVLDLPVPAERVRDAARAVLDGHGVRWEVRGE